MLMKQRIVTLGAILGSELGRHACVTHDLCASKE